jgi:predicted GIY-YIG superfamily endonuclease
MQEVTVYAIAFDAGPIYVGMASDMTRRLGEHRRRQTRSLRRLEGAFRLIYRRRFGSYAEARRHEKFMKSGAGRALLVRKLTEKEGHEGSPRFTR